MNIIAIDIGNTNITIALYLDDDQRFVKSIDGRESDELTECLKSAWGKIPVAPSSRENRRDGVIVASSVKPAWTAMVEKILRDNLDEQLYLVGREIPLPMKVDVDEPEDIGTDRVLSASAAYEVVGNAVIVADFGTAVTIDVVDEDGSFIGGIICPGFEISAAALNVNTALLPKVKVSKPKKPYGKNTRDAINCGLYYSAIGTLEEVVRRFSEELGKWPQTVITGAAAKVIVEDCSFVDSYVTNLVVKGVVLAYKKYLEEKYQ